MYTDILIPTDGSDNVEPAIQYGFDIARRYDATVHALHVVDSSPIERKLELTALETDLETLPDTWYEAGDDATKQIGTRAAEHGLDAVTEVRRGIPAREIRSYITDTGIDLVCMGTRGHTGLDRVLLGSVTTRIVRTVDIPVLSVKAKPAISESETQGGFENILIPTDGSKPAREAVTHALDLARTYDATLSMGMPTRWLISPPSKRQDSANWIVCRSASVSSLGSKSSISSARLFDPGLMGHDDSGTAVLQRLNRRNRIIGCALLGSRCSRVSRVPRGSRRWFY